MKNVLNRLRSTYDIWCLDYSYASHVIDEIAKLKDIHALKQNNIFMKKYLEIFPDERERYEIWLEKIYLKYYKEKK